jgi:hypothetical protein
MRVMRNRSEPEARRLLLFDGAIRHAGKPPTANALARFTSQ